MKIRSCAAFIFLLLIILIIMGSCCASTANAQATETPTPTNTPTATPDVVDEIDINGDIFYIERRISYGEIAVVIAAMTILLPALIYFTFKIVTHYLR